MFECFGSLGEARALAAPSPPPPPPSRELLHPRQGKSVISEPQPALPVGPLVEVLLLHHTLTHQSGNIRLTNNATFPKSPVFVLFCFLEKHCGSVLDKLSQFLVISGDVTSSCCRFKCSRNLFAVKEPTAGRRLGSVSVPPAGTSEGR